MLRQLGLHLKSGALREMESLFTGDETARTMIVSADILAAVTPPFADTKDGVRLGEFRAWLDDFMEGCELTVSEDPFNKPPGTMFARVAPVEDEFWSIRVTEPRDLPGIRSLGAFAAKDEFIALTWNYRETIGTEFYDEIDSVRTAWNGYFGSANPHSGGHIYDYLTIYRHV
jgi:hypothetical protein